MAALEASGKSQPDCGFGFSGISIWVEYDDPRLPVAQQRLCDKYGLQPIPIHTTVCPRRPPGKAGARFFTT